MSKVAVPGLDLPGDEMWQVVETELMTRGDYDRLLDMGWPDFFNEFMSQKILRGVPQQYLPPDRKSPDVQKAWRTEGVPVLSGGDVMMPFELLSAPAAETSITYGDPRRRPLLWHGCCHLLVRLFRRPNRRQTRWVWAYRRLALGASHAVRPEMFM